jgi:hypothetical protein
MSALRAGRPTALDPQKDSLYSFLLQPVDPRATVCLQGLGHLKITLLHQESNLQLS